MDANALDLSTTPVHLGGTSAEPVPGFDGSPAWFERYAAEHPEPGFLVSSFTFDRPWDSWEVHPAGHELVVCTAGTITLHQETAAGKHRTVALQPNEYVVNEPGTWHTADVDGPATALFVTSGEGTAHRPR
ncbi:MAG TPA: cupin [Acidimicrobiales bacterium]|nr:cupin [Acidimicrobiales bacterium]